MVNYHLTLASASTNNKPHVGNQANIKVTMQILMDNEMYLRKTKTAIFKKYNTNMTTYFLTNLTGLLVLSG